MCQTPYCKPLLLPICALAVLCFLSVAKLTAQTKSYYDPVSKATYLFTEDSQTALLPSEKNAADARMTFRAKPDVLLLQLTHPQHVEQLTRLGYTPEEIIPHVYKIKVKEDIIAEKTHLETLAGVAYV